MRWGIMKKIADYLDKVKGLLCREYENSFDNLQYNYNSF